MSESSSLGQRAAATAEKSDEQGLHVLIERLEVLVDVFRYALETEFWYSHEVIEDWKDNLTMLRDGLWPLDQYLAIHPLLAERHQCSLDRVKDLILCARDAFQVEGLAPRQQIRQSSRWIVGALNAIGAWSDEVRSPAENVGQFEGLIRQYPLLCGVPGETRAKWLLNGTLEELAARIATGSDRDRCMGSRKLYLVSHYVAYLFPKLWETCGKRKFSDLHGRLLDRMEPGTLYKRSVQARLDDAEALIEGQRLVA